MIREKLKLLQKYKKTTDLYRKPTVLLEDTEELDRDAHLDLISEKIEGQKKFKTIVETKLFRSDIDRMSITETMERQFNKHIKKSLKGLLSTFYDQQNDETKLIFHLIIDFHIKYHFIDRYNKDELLILLLPFHKDYEKELLDLGFDCTYDSFLVKMKNRKFFSLLLTFIETAPSFFNGLLSDFFRRKHKIQVNDFHKRSFEQFIGRNGLEMKFLDAKVALKECSQGKSADKSQSKYNFFD